MVKEELEFQEKDKISTTYERRAMKHHHGRKKQATENNDEEQQRHYVYIQSLEIQEENPIGEIGKINEDVNIIFDQQITEEILELDTQTIEKTPTDKQDQDNEHNHYFSYICTTNHRKRKIRVLRLEEGKI